jgi:hypothetical protein
VDEWAHRKNIDRFERDLQAETDPETRRRLEEFLKRERGWLEEAIRKKRGS